MGPGLCESSLLGTCPRTVSGISEGCVAYDTQQPGRMVDFSCCDGLSDFSGSLWHTEWFVCLVRFLLVVATDQLDIQCLCATYHLHLDIPTKQK